VVAPVIAAQLKRPAVGVLGTGEAIKHLRGGELDLTHSAGVHPADTQYASLYDSFAITVLMQIEDLGFCAKGEGGRFVGDGNLISGVGPLPFNTDGGGLGDWWQPLTGNSGRLLQRRGFSDFNLHPFSQ
jgi:acetyl-CoA C-acetyltransferase